LQQFKHLVRVDIDTGVQIVDKNALSKKNQRASQFLKTLAASKEPLLEENLPEVE